MLELLGWALAAGLGFEPHGFVREERAGSVAVMRAGSVAVEHVPCVLYRCCSVMIATLAEGLTST